MRKARAKFSAQIPEEAGNWAKVRQCCETSRPSQPDWVDTKSMAVLAFAKVSNDADYEQSAFWLEVFRENEYSNGDRGGHIQKLNCYPAFTSAYDECRGKEAIQETTNAPKGFETDNLASLTYHVFPKYFVTPFHYDPVAQK